MSNEIMRASDWGWPTQIVAVHPAPGDHIELPGGTVAVVIDDDGHKVVFGVGESDEQGEWPEGGHLRTSATADGLFLFLTQLMGERDGYRCFITEDGLPGRRRWKVARGREVVDDG